MTGLIVFGFLGSAIAFLIWTTRAGSKAGARAWGQRWGGLGGGALTLLLVTSPLTWDTIPTLVSYRHQCESAGLQVFKNLDQWRRENLGRDGERVRLPKRPYPTERLDDGGTRNQLNSRFAYENRKISLGYVVADDTQLIDLQTREILARQRLVETGKGELRLYAGISGLDDFKFWLTFGPCGSVSKGQDGIYTIIESFKRAGEIE